MRRNRPQETNVFIIYQLQSLSVSLSDSIYSFNCGDILRPVQGNEARCSVPAVWLQCGRTTGVNIGRRETCLGSRIGLSLSL